MKRAILIIFATPLYLLLEGLGKLIVLILQIPLAAFWIAMFIKSKRKHKELYENRT